MENRNENQSHLKDESLLSFAGNKKFRQSLIWLFTAAIILAVIIYAFKPSQRDVSSKEIFTQIYPNYIFQDGLNRIKVPLIPTNQLLSSEAGGWVITPEGSEWIVDNKVAVNVEFIDGRKVYCEPHNPIYVGVRPANRIFRIYGSERDSVSISIKRNVY